MEVEKIAAIEKKCFLDKIVAEVETWKNSRNQKAKKKPPTLNPKKIAANINPKNKSDNINWIILYVIT